MQSELHTLSGLMRLIMSPTILNKDFNAETNQQQYESILISYREQVRSQLLFAQNELAGKYSKKICNFMLFPIIANIDEKCKILLTKKETTIKWDALQIEFFQRADGGEYVFDILDEVISNKIYPKITYEVLLVILQDNFLGKYYDNPNHAERHQYIKNLKEILEGFNKETPNVDFLQQKRTQAVYNGKKIKKILVGVVIIAIILPVSIYLYT